MSAVFQPPKWSPTPLQTDHLDKACTAYTRYILDIGASQDWLALQIVLAPCLLGYGAIAQMLRGHPSTKMAEDGNMYWGWIENYVADDYTEAVRLGSGTASLPPWMNSMATAQIR